ncbi:MAG: hypothetical protein V7609_510 [Verrucomicrobiota bacterium]
MVLAFAFGIAANVSFLEAADYKPATRGQPEKKFVVKPGGLLTFDADIGYGEVETGDYESVRIEFKSYYKVETAEEVEELYDKIAIEMSQTDNNVKVTVRFADNGNQTQRDKVRLNFKLHMPRKFNLDLRTGGNVGIDDVDGTVRASTTAGYLALGNVTGPATATSKGGSLKIGNIGGDLETRSEGGSTTIGKVGGRVVSVTEGGSLSIKEAVGAIDATVNAGSVTAYMPNSPRSDCRITANAGGIDLRLGESVAVTIDAACTAGTVMSDFKIAAKKGGSNRNELKGDMNGGGPLLVLRATKGSIHLNK